MNEPTSGDETNPSPNVADTFGSKLASLGKAAWQETQRNARLAALKAKIEKLKLVDLNKAHYALGRKAYELRIVADKLEAEYDEIAALEATIKAKRAGIAVEITATKSKRIKDSAISAKMQAEAEGLELKLKQYFVALGREVVKAGEFSELNSERGSIESITSGIEQLEQEYSKTSGDHKAQGQLRNLSASLAKEAGEKSRATWTGGLDAFNRRFPQKFAIPFLLCSILGVVIIFIYDHVGPTHLSESSHPPDLLKLAHDAKSLKPGSFYAPAQNTTCEWVSPRFHGFFPAPRPCRTEISSSCSGDDLQLLIKQSWKYLSPSEVSVDFGGPKDYYVSIPIGMEWRSAELGKVAFHVSDIETLVKLIRQYLDTPISTSNDDSENAMGKLGDTKVIFESQGTCQMVKFVGYSGEVSLERPEVGSMLNLITTTLRIAIERKDPAHLSPP